MFSAIPFLFIFLHTLKGNFQINIVFIYIMNINFLHKQLLGKLLSNPNAEYTKAQGTTSSGSVSTTKETEQRADKTLRASRLFKLSNNHVDKLTPIDKNPELIEAFNILSAEDSGGFERKFCNEVGLRATLSGKKPLTYFDDKFNPKAVRTLLKYADEIARQTEGTIRIFSTDPKSISPTILLFNAQKLKETIEENQDFYKMHFPDCSSSDEIVDALFSKIKKEGMGYGSLMGVSLGFPLGDTLLFSTQGKYGEKIPQDKLLSLLSDEKWAKHREVVQCGQDEDLTWKIKKAQNTPGGFVTWDPYTENAQNMFNILNEDLHSISNTNIMDYFGRLIKQ